MTSIVCDVCPRACKLEEGEIGSCGVRKNVGGTNQNRIHGQIAEVYCWPGKFVDICFPGCGSRCPWCLAADIHDALACQTRPMNERDIPGLVRSQPGPPGYGLPTARFTGGEPALHFEYVEDACFICRLEGIQTVIQSGGYIMPWVAERLARAVDCPVLSFKGSGSPRVYEDMQSSPAPVYEAVKASWRANKRLMIGNLVDAELKSTPEDDRSLARWLCQEISPDVPVGLCPKFDGITEDWYRQPIVTRPEERWQYLLAAAERMKEEGLKQVVTLIDIPYFLKHGVMRSRIL